eukprot:5410070-Prorocentrum_lima.AAC.1
MKVGHAVGRTVVLCVGVGWTAIRWAAVGWATATAAGWAAVGWGASAVVGWFGCGWLGCRLGCARGRPGR